MTEDPRTETPEILQCIMPILCCIVLPFSLLNIYILVVQKAWQRPSHFIYLNMLVADTLAVGGGVIITVYFARGSGPNEAKECYIATLLVSFYSGMVLLFGLGICRVLSNMMSAMYFLEKGLQIARGIVAAAWFLGIAKAVTRQNNLGNNNDYLQATINLLVLVVACSTIAINLHIWMKIRRAVGHIAQSSYREANKTALLLFANCLVWNLLYIASYGYYAYTLLQDIAQHSKSDMTCAERPNVSWVEWVMQCDDGVHFYGGTVLLAESIGNNVVLITQRESREVLYWLKCYWKQVLGQVLPGSNSAGYARFH